MIVLEDKAESPSTQRASTAYSSQCQLRQSNRFEAAENSKQRGLPGEALTAHSAHWPTSDSNDRLIVRSRSDGTLYEKTIPFGLPSLNQELLQLELTVATLEADAKPQVQVQTVYNFVDVPIGHSVEEVYYDPAATENYNDLAGPEPASLQPEGYEDPDSLYADDYYRDYDNAPQQNELLYDNSHEVYVADYPDEPPYPPRHYRQYNDPQAIDGRFLNDEGMLDHESGYYTHE